MATAQMVRDVMTAPPVEVDPNAYVTDVARRMRDEDIGAVVVTEEGHPRGLVTDRDLTVRILAEGGDISGVRVQDACSTDLVTLKPDDPVDRAAELMREKAVRLPRWSIPTGTASSASSRWATWPSNATPTRR